VAPIVGVGDWLGSYHLDAVLGRGGMGVVYLATDKRLSRKVAVKVVAPELAEDETFSARFVREARLAAAIDHPHILPIYEVGEQDGVLFLASRYVDGSDLRDLLLRDGPLASPRAVEIIRQIGSALDAAHARGLVHRDVKPANILIARSYDIDHAYLTDFGLTKERAETAGLSLTGQVVGTLDYIAPEQLRGEELDGGADLYALGCVLYQALSGQPPYSGTDVAVMLGHLQDPAPTLGDLDRYSKSAFDAVVRRAMAKDRRDRYANGGQLAAAALAALEHLADTGASRDASVLGSAPADRSVNPDVCYARNGDVSIAFEVVGDGPIDLVFLPGFINNLEVVWDNPLLERFLDSLASFSRLILIDRRGAGLSDRLSPADLPLLEDLADDVTAVLDTLRSDRAALLGTSDCGSLCAMFAASHPERVAALILYATSAKGAMSNDYQIGWTDDEWDTYLLGLKNEWGTLRYARESLPQFDPSLKGDEEMAAWYASFQRLSASPTSARAIERLYYEMDVRSLLHTISVPTLVMNRTGDAIEPVEAGRYIADRIPGARFVELPGEDHHAWAGDQDAIVREVERFLSHVSDQEADLDRILATVMFTDIVGSTQHALEIGDCRWRELVTKHDSRVRAQLARFRGHEVDSVGDGILATFDGPARAIRCACAISESVRELGIQIRAGLHAGECQRAGPNVRGIAVHIAARVAAQALPGEVLVSSTVRELVAGSALRFDDRGARVLEGVPDPVQLFAVIPTALAIQ
jgi:serine/threonine protein kinase/class 3 adenylate cyclase